MCNHLLSVDVEKGTGEGLFQPFRHLHQPLDILPVI